MRGRRPTRSGRGGQGGQQVGGVRAPVARQQGHLVVVLGCGQAGVRRWGGNREEGRGKQERRRQEEGANTCAALLTPLLLYQMIIGSAQH